MPYRKTFSSVSKTALVCFAALLVCSESRAADSQKLAVVNVSFVFEKYMKVKDIQTRIDSIHEARKKELDVRGKELQEANRRLNDTYNQSGQSEPLFDEVQRLRKLQFVYERDVAQLNMQIQKDYTREMREVLSDIRQAIKAHAETSGYDMVLRSPDSDNPDAVQKTPGKMSDPNEQNAKTFLQKNEAQSTAEVIERFNRNPVLFGSTTVDITQEVLERLNGAFMKRAMTAIPGK